MSVSHAEKTDSEIAQIHIKKRVVSDYSPELGQADGTKQIGEGVGASLPTGYAAP